MKNLYFLIAAAALVLAVASCKKDCTAGKGGNLTIVAFPKHHGKDTQPWYAYVKFGSKDSPGTNAADYDLVVQGDTSENHIHIEDMKCGDYYIYMVSYDKSIGDTTVGGIPFSTDKANGEVDIDVPVTE